jgi:hypothetical protein
MKWPAHHRRIPSPSIRYFPPLRRRRRNRKAHFLALIQSETTIGEAGEVFLKCWLSFKTFFCYFYNSVENIRLKLFYFVPRSALDGQVHLSQSSPQSGVEMVLHRVVSSE